MRQYCGIRFKLENRNLESYLKNVPLASGFRTPSLMLTNESWNLSQYPMFMTTVPKSSAVLRVTKILVKRLSF